jgi:hypothetical protein
MDLPAQLGVNPAGAIHNCHLEKQLVGSHLIVLSAYR